MPAFRHFDWGPTLQGRCEYEWSFWGVASFGLVNWHDVFTVPYVLAATTLAPATITLLAFGLILLAKMQQNRHAYYQKSI
jgi:hypothetical protein